ncbi:putative [histone H3]-lysine(4) N-trimethyltransferase [Dioscorea sansibarensis]
MENFVHEEEEVDHPVRYLPIGRLYSPSPTCINTSGSSKIMSKKVKARKVLEDEDEELGNTVIDHGGVDTVKVNSPVKPLLVYKRASKKHRPPSDQTSFLDKVSHRAELQGDGGSSVKGNAALSVVDLEKSELGCDWAIVKKEARKRKNSVNYELLSFGDGIRKSARLSGSASNERTNYAHLRRRSRGACKESRSLSKQKKWVELSYQGVDPHAFVGLACKVFWPMDDEWYKGTVTAFVSAFNHHHVEYDDGDVENLVLLNEKIKFHVSPEEMECLDLKFGAPNVDNNDLNYDEMLALAASSDCQDLEPGDLVWAKLTGYAMWPALIMDESFIGGRKGLKRTKGDRSVLVQFFGTHDFARINLKQAIPFLNGLLTSLHLKCKQTSFCRSLDEAKIYLSNQQLPERMLLMQQGINAKECSSAFNEDEERCSSFEDNSGDEVMQKAVERIKTPLDFGNILLTNLGKVVYDSEYFHNKQYIWPEGYIAFRKFISVKDPSLIASYKMEVLRNPKFKGRPMFRVTLDNGEQIDGPNPTTCWEQVYSRIKTILLCDGQPAEIEGSDFQQSGSYMFGFTNPQISQLIKDLPNSKFCSKYFGSCRDLPVGYRAVHVEWKDLDRCGVCHMDEEYEDNLFLQCEKCRVMVHARCYGELEPLGGILWLCNLCRLGSPKYPPPCCLCPVTGGVMKPTTDGRWAHLACAMWIPETCLLDVKKMEPIDGLNRINKDRWRLLCSICSVSYGACIQCSNKSCRVAYHPLCARAAGLCVELEGDCNLHLMAMDEDDDKCIRLLSFCKKHSQPSTKHIAKEDKRTLPSQNDSSCPIFSSSGCARSEPYIFSGRVVQKDSQVFAAATVKRRFLEDTPYLVSGYCQNGSRPSSSLHESAQGLSLSGVSKLRTQSESFGTMAGKYESMKETLRKRLTFGKSRIHGFGVFAKRAHKAGDMVIEYTGELVRSPIADIREHSIYNALVGAGTYMFRIDDERVVDATRAGSIAHLINHSCEPNCFSRMISVNGGEHIIIFAKRDINQWEELTYDYRYFSTDKQLACNCGFPRCRGVVNDITEVEEQVTKIRVPQCDVVLHREIENKEFSAVPRRPSTP